MKTLHFSIILLLLIIIIGINSTFAEESQKYYGNLNPPTIHFIPDNTSSLEVKIKQGDFIQFPFHVTLDKKYRMDAVNFYLGDLPTSVHGWIDPQTLFTKFNDIHSTNGTIYLYVDSNTTPGDYTIAIVGQGVITDLTTNDAIQILNRTIVLADKPMKDDKEILQRQQESRPVLAILHLSVLPNPNDISLNLGNADSKTDMFCLDLTEGQSCSGFIAYQKFPITIYSKDKASITLETENLPPDGWLKITPSRLVANSSGSVATMTMSGMMEPFLINPLDTKIMMVRAVADNGKNAIAYLPIINDREITVLKSEDRIKLSNGIILNTNGSSMAINGLVYDPADSTKNSMPVHLSVLGLLDGSDITPLPSWIQVKIPNPVFSLNSSEPFYFMIQVNTASAPIGNHTIAIGEDIGTRHFVTDFMVKVIEPMRSYPAGVGTVYGWLSVWELGGIIAGSLAGVGGFIYFYTRLRK